MTYFGTYSVGEADRTLPFISLERWSIKERTTGPYPMQRTTAIIGSTIFFIIAPCVAVGLIPFWITRWQFQPPLFGLELTRFFGGGFILAGIPVIVDSFVRFALEGLGTPAPVAPPRQLVVTGLYRHVRNPIYVSVVAVVLDQELVFADWRLIAYGGVFWLLAHAYVVTYEEPTLKRTFGAAYDVFCSNVPRWLPRPTPWPGAEAGGHAS